MISILIKKKLFWIGVLGIAVVFGMAGFLKTSFGAPVCGFDLCAPSNPGDPGDPARCSGDFVQTCGNCDDDFYDEWCNTATACQYGCEAGVCKGAPCVDNDRDGYGVCPNCGAAKGCTYDEEDCDDTMPFGPHKFPGNPETCDNNDNNCNSTVDEGCDDDGDNYCDAAMPVYNAPVAVCNLTRVADGLLGNDCNDMAGFGFDINPGKTEICDGVDNNCNGKIDGEEISCECKAGEIQSCGSSNTTPCKFGSRSCANGKWGLCFGAIEPVVESCDGKDNDCSGTDDDNLTAPTCARQAGVCDGTRQRCGGASGWLACTVADYGSNYQATENLCDGLDNDCDDQTDENLTGALCPLQQGVCAGSRQQCGDSSGWLVCGPGNYGLNYQSAETSCNDNRDNDCDSKTDCTDEDCFNSTACCGDDNIRGTEQCDDGIKNGQACTAAYDSSCTYCSAQCQSVTVRGPYCGDNNTNRPNEQCDNGSQNGVVCVAGYGQTCNYCAGDCSQLITVTGPRCGDTKCDLNNNECSSCSGDCGSRECCNNNTCEAADTACSAGSNDKDSCPDNPCYEPACTNGACGRTPVAVYTADEACHDDAGCAGGECRCDGVGTCKSYKNLCPPDGSFPTGMIFCEDFESGNLLKWEATAGINNEQLGSNRFAQIDYSPGTGETAQASRMRRLAVSLATPPQSRLYIKYDLFITSNFHIGPFFFYFLNLFQEPSYSISFLHRTDYGPAPEQIVFRAVSDNNRNIFKEWSVLEMSKLTKNSWHKIEVFIQYNQAGQANGVHQIWVDGNLISNKNDVVYKNGSEVYNRLEIPSFGGDDGHLPTMGDVVFVDNVQIWAGKPAGASGGGTTPTQNLTASIILPTAPADGYARGDYLKFSAAVSGGSGRYIYSWQDGTTSLGTTAEIVTDALAQGTHTIRLTATDTASGGTATASQNITVGPPACRRVYGDGNHNKLDLVYIRDFDRTPEEFEGDIDGFLNYVHPQGKDYYNGLFKVNPIKNYTNKFNVYYYTVKELYREPSSSLDAMQFANSQDFLDVCSFANGIGFASQYSGRWDRIADRSKKFRFGFNFNDADPYNWLGQIHEAGHALFGLLDIYYRAGVQACHQDYNRYCDFDMCNNKRIANGWTTDYICEKICLDEKDVEPCIKDEYNRYHYRLADPDEYYETSGIMTGRGAVFNPDDIKRIEYVLNNIYRL